jgi:AraC-like DNA-binding protein
LLLQDFIPAVDVQEYVQLYRIVHLQFNKNDYIPIKAYPPRPEHCLAFYPYDTETVTYNNSNKKIEQLPIVLYGQFNEVTNRTIGHNFLVFQIIFYPGALYKLLNISAQELTNVYMDATLVFKDDIKNINEQLYFAKNYIEMVEIGNSFVRTLIKKKQKPLRLIDTTFFLLLKNDGQIPITELAKIACLSTKQFERNFLERCGINPKLYQRIIRFDKAFRLRNAYPHYDWLKIAIECGYHDYQHLVKDYTAFTNLNPNAFHEIENQAPERKFGLNEGFYTQK